MKDVCQLLIQKEADLARVRKELESLNIVAPLLTDDTERNISDAPGSCEGSDDNLSISLSDTISQLSDLARTNAEEMFPSGFWNSHKRAG